MALSTLVTGASSGIGREMAKLVAEDHRDLVLVARNKKKLDEFARDLTAAFAVAVRVIAKDLARSDAPAEIARELASAGVAVDTLVNNAGFGVYGPFAETDSAKELEMLQVNIFALTRLTKLFLPPMVERKSGRILNVASTAAFQPGPLMAVYYASKAYVLSFTEALANEVAAHGVVVTALCPGPTDTEFQKEAGLEETHLFRSPFVQDARSVARAGYSGLAAGKRIVIPGFANQTLAQGVRFAPRRLVTAIARWFQEQKKKKA